MHPVGMELGGGIDACPLLVIQITSNVDRVRLSLS